MRMHKLRGALALVLWAIVALVLREHAASSAEIEKLVLSNGTVIDYAMVLPAHFNKENAYPALLVFPGGNQTMETVRGALKRYWESEAARRGFILICPAAPNGISFIDGSERLIPEFLQHFLSEYRIKMRKFHVAGNSNGGKSAFHVAILYPELFRSLTVLAGFPPDEADMGHLGRLKGIPINMFVGESDPIWLVPMLETKAKLEALGMDVFFRSFRRNGHFLPALSFENSGKIFDHIGQ